jgi:hypothetical protein
MMMWGPGGVGKTAICHEHFATARKARVPVTHLDARTIDPTPGDFLRALSTALGHPPSAVLGALQQSRRRHLIVVDTYEAIAPLDPWVRDVLAPALPDHVKLVLSGRRPPHAAWRALPWASTIEVRELAPAESRQLLRQRAIPAHQHAAILQFAQGHPLALCLVAELCTQRPKAQFRPETSPQVIRALMPQFVEQLPDARHRAALEAATVVRSLTQPLLAATLGEPDVEDLFNWLAERSFIETNDDGLFPHDLARDVLTYELRWRDPDRHARLIEQAHRYQRSRVQRCGTLRDVLDWLYLHRTNPVFRSAFTLPTSGELYADHARPADIPALIEIVRRHEGELSARVAAHWFARQPEGIRVIRSSPTNVVGLVMILTLDHATPAADLSIDPGAVAVWRHAQVAPAEAVTLYRYVMTADGYQAVGPELSLCFMVAMRHDLLVPGQTIAYMTFADPDFWAAVAHYSGAVRTPDADFAVGDRKYGIYCKDWRAISPQVLYFDRMLAHSLGMQAEPEDLPPPVRALSLEAFRHAVKRALRDYCAPLALRTNPILHTRLIASAAGISPTIEARVETVRALLREAAAALRARPRSGRFIEALETTYFEPDMTQELAADRLGLPFTTYRYQLARGIDRVVDELWQRELGAV